MSGTGIKSKARKRRQSENIDPILRDVEKVYDFTEIDDKPAPANRKNDKKKTLKAIPKGLVGDDTPGKCVPAKVSYLFLGNALIWGMCSR